MGSGFKQFLKAFCRHWALAMSGGFSVPFNIAGAFTDGLTRAICVALGIACLVIAAYFVWKAERERADELAEKLRLKLKCSFSMAEGACLLRGVTVRFIKTDRPALPSGVSITTDMAVNMGFFSDPPSFVADYFRLKVYADRMATISGCQGRILWIEREGKRILDAPVILPFAPSEQSDALRKEIHQGAPEYLDVLAITYENKVRLTPPNHHRPSSINYDEIFPGPGEYRLRLAIASNAPTVECELVLKWTGDRTTAEVAYRAVETKVATIGPRA